MKARQDEGAARRRRGKTKARQDEGAARRKSASQFLHSEKQETPGVQRLVFSVTQDYKSVKNYFLTGSEGACGPLEKEAIIRYTLPMPHRIRGDKGLDQEQVQVWKADLDLETAQILELEQSLSPEERARADRFHFAGDRARFIAARGSLRVILGDYLRLPPHQVQFAYTSDNKPVLAGEETLRFNLSHSDALAVIAVTRGREIGIDIECLRTDFEADALARRFFSPAECDALFRTPPAERHAAFLSLWTCKEAYLKAVGTGLRSSLREFTVFPDDRSIVLTGPAGDGADIAPYDLHLLTPSPGYVAALAIERLRQG